MSMSKLSLFYALVSAENKGIQLVHTSWIIISLCKFFVIPPCQSIESPTCGAAEWNYANF